MVRAKSSGIPVRTCVGCRRRADSTDLVRVVAVTRGATIVASPDPHGSAAGRGAHLHPTSRCLEQARRRKAFDRALRVAGKVDLTEVAEFVRGHDSGDLPSGKEDEEKWSTRS